MSVFANSPCISGIWEMRRILEGTGTSLVRRVVKRLFLRSSSCLPKISKEDQERGLVDLVEPRQVPQEGDRDVVLLAAAEPVGWM
jgi:hypothetical protein